MTITAHITNFRGCARADLVCDPICLIGGLNAAGKSSIAQAVGSALTGNALPIAGMRANAAGALVRSGEAVSTVEVSSDDGSAMVEWPSARVTTGGKAPTANVYAVGLESIVTLATKDRLRVVAEYLHADPTREDLAAALGEAGITSDRALDTLWSLIEQQGWDGAERVRRERGAEMKGQWRQATGANYGSRVAASWRPDLAELAEADLVAAVNKAKVERDHALSAEAVSDAERRRLEGEVDLLDARHEALARITARLSEYTEAHKKAQEARQALPPASQPTTIPCPYCASPIVISRAGPEVRFEKADAAPLNDEVVRKRRMTIAEADGKVAHAYDDLNQARRDLTQAEVAIRDSLQARDRLGSWPRAVESGTDRNTAEAALARAEKRLGEFREKQEADRLHQLIELNDHVIGLLGGDGLRAVKLARVLDVFNKELATLCATANWWAVKLDEAGAITFGNRPFAFLSSSEKYRVRATLAVAMAKLDGSELVILDGADILDAPSRSGLLTLLDTIGIPALVCMTLPRREMLPDLAALGAGRSYWLAGGIAEAMAERAAA
jgi:hypothetical protein